MKFTTEVTLKNPPIEATDADEARALTRKAYDGLLWILGRKNAAPAILEIVARIHKIADEKIVNDEPARLHLRGCASQLLSDLAEAEARADRAEAALSEALTQREEYRVQRDKHWDRVLELTRSAVRSALTKETPDPLRDPRLFGPVEAVTVMTAPSADRPLVGTCLYCKKRPATLHFGDMLSFTHGGIDNCCEICCAEMQLNHAKERAVAIPELEAKVAALAATGEGEEET